MLLIVSYIKYSTAKTEDLFYSFATKIGLKNAKEIATFSTKIGLKNAKEIANS